MLQHELKLRLLRVFRPLALALVVLCAAMAWLRWQQAGRFLAQAHQAQGTVLAVAGGGRATIGVLLDNGQQIRFTADDASGAVPGASVPVAYLAAPGQPVDARLATPHALWAAGWAWVEAALGFALAAVFGRALVQDPLSVIGFKSWRLFERRPRA